MKLGKKFIVSLLFSAIGICSTGLAFSYAWFVRTVSRPISTIDGSMLKSYFHTADGDGSQEHPFVITRPKHFENLAWLHKNVEGFDEAGFYIEIGYKFDGEHYQVYNYNDSGTPTGEYGENLNLTYLSDIIPIGSSLKPFTGHLDGHGITVSNFTVAGYDGVSEGYSDIGIFGYVDASGTCANTYFDNFTIDVTGCDALAPVKSDAPHTDHEDNTVNIGYLAGHVAEAASFSNVYINHCSLSGVSASYYSKSTYGYYGKADNENGGSGSSGGANYSFTFDSQAFYDYFNSNWSRGNSMSNSYIREQGNNPSYTRNADRAYEYGNTTTKPLNNTAMSRNYSLIAGNSYNLLGDAPGGTDKEDNFSVSTLGYHTQGTVTDELEYETFYRKNGEDYTLPSDSTLTDKPMNINGDGGSATDPSQYGCFYRYDKDAKKWTYYKSSNYYTSNVTNRSLTFSYDGNFSYTDSSAFIYNNSGLPVTVVTSVYLDENTTPVSTLTTTGVGSSSIFSSTISVKLDDDSPKSLTIPDLYIGTHYVSVVSRISIEFEWTTFVDYLVYSASASVSGGVLSTTPLAVNLNNTTNSSVVLTNNSTWKNTKFNSTVNSVNYAARYCERPLSGGNLNEGPFDMYAVSIDTGEKMQMRYDVGEVNSFTDLNCSFSVVEVEDVDTLGNLITVNRIHVIRQYTHSVEEGDIYIADDPNILASGFNPNNLDVVGGGVSFSDNYCTLVSENRSTSHFATNAIPNTDVINNAQFYATKYCANSIVLYLRNLNDSDGTMGSINLYYTLNVGKYLNLTLKQPAFKKGWDPALYDGSIEEPYAPFFVDFSNFNTEAHPNDYEDLEGDRTDDRITTIKVRRDTIEKACFCALYAYGRLIAKYDYNGNLVALATNKSEKDIKTYVLAIGVLSTTSNLTINTRIQKIEFAFKAEGNSGNFGTVEYRSREANVPEVTNSILTFIFTANLNVEFNVSVSYTPNTEDEYGTYTVLASIVSGDELTITFYLYDTNYTLIINGEDMTSDSASITLTS